MYLFENFFLAVKYFSEFFFDKNVRFDMLFKMQLLIFRIGYGVKLGCSWRYFAKVTLKNVAINPKFIQ